MIFVTVGTQLPFDRLVGTVDAWLAKHPDERGYAQVGTGAAPVRHLEAAPFVSAAECERRMREADLVVAHAGMGSILTALGLQKPIVVMPRRAELGEHRNDHQMATARWLAKYPGVHVVWNEQELLQRLDDRAAIVGGPGIGPYASPELVANLRKFLFA